MEGEHFSSSGHFDWAARTNAHIDLRDPQETYERELLVISMQNRSDQDGKFADFSTGPKRDYKMRDERREKFKI